MQTLAEENERFTTELNARAEEAARLRDANGRATAAIRARDDALALAVEARDVAKAAALDAHERAARSAVETVELEENCAPRAARRSGSVARWSGARPTASGGTARRARRPRTETRWRPPSRGSVANANSSGRSCATPRRGRAREMERDPSRGRGRGGARRRRRRLGRRKPRGFRAEEHAGETDGPPRARRAPRRGLARCIFRRSIFRRRRWCWNPERRRDLERAFGFSTS